MMTFKEYLREDEDITHKVEEAAKVFVEHCKQWKDVDTPLYRLSHPGGGAHKIRTRSPRLRKSESLAGTREIQKVIFEQKGWERFPDRLHSIFCSTKKQFAVGEVDDFSENLLMIYPFDGVTMGSTTDVEDFNYTNLLKGMRFTPQSIMNFWSYIRFWKGYITDGPIPRDEPFAETLGFLKKTMMKNGKFDPDANGNTQYQKNLNDLKEEQWEELRAVVTKLPQMWTPKNLGVELLTPATIDLPGPVREVWFSGKYLSVPALDHMRFTKAVKALQSGEEPTPQKVSRVTRTKDET